jgi:hypothetical protein
MAVITANRRTSATLVNNHQYPTRDALAPCLRRRRQPGSEGFNALVWHESTFPSPPRLAGNAKPHRISGTSDPFCKLQRRSKRQPGIVTDANLEIA